MAYTNINDPSAHFQVKTGVGASSPQSHTFDGNSNLQPDFLWWKRRDSSGNHALHDSSRGVNKFLYANSSTDQQTDGNLITSFDTDGWSTGSSWFDLGSQTWVTWAWKANGGTTSSNTDGSITSTVQANQDAGFSIVTYTGTGSAATVGHGLGEKPAMILVKRTDSTGNWYVAHKGLDNMSSWRFILQVNFSAGSSTAEFGVEPTSSVFSVNTSSATNASGGTHVAYCFAEKQGYSKMGNVTGNGNANGPFVYTGFKPAFLFYRNYTVNGDGAGWIYDGTRSEFNVITAGRIRTDSSSAEVTENATSGLIVDFLSNGFKIRGNTDRAWNYSGDKYIFTAFAENPFTTSTGIPTTAR